MVAADLLLHGVFGFVVHLHQLSVCGVAALRERGSVRVAGARLARLDPLVDRAICVGMFAVNA
jgi:hypothetical protein